MQYLFHRHWDLREGENSHYVAAEEWARKLTTGIIPVVYETKLGDLCIGSDVEGAQCKYDVDIGKEKPMLPDIAVTRANAGPEGTSTHDVENDNDAIEGGSDDRAIQPSALDVDLGRLVLRVRHCGVARRR